MMIGFRASEGDLPSGRVAPSPRGHRLTEAVLQLAVGLSRRSAAPAEAGSLPGSSALQHLHEGIHRVAWARDRPRKGTEALAGHADDALLQQDILGRAHGRVADELGAGSAADARCSIDDLDLSRWERYGQRVLDLGCAAGHGIGVVQIALQGNQGRVPRAAPPVRERRLWYSCGPWWPTSARASSSSRRRGS